MKSGKKIKFLALFLINFLPVLVFAQTAGLYRDLQIGSTGEDVRLLQQWLNTHGFPISTTGLGSLGNETTYFGLLTQTALARYQVSVGINPATGNLNAATRAMISGSSGQVGSANLPAGCVSAAGFSPLTGVRCDSSLIFGANLPAGCVSTTGFSPLTGIKCDNNQSGTTQILSGSSSGQNTAQQQVIYSGSGQNVPSSLGLAGFSADLSGWAGFSLPPEVPLSTTMGISSIFPSSGSNGTRVTITGYGFSKTKNKVYTGFGVVEVGSSDGKTLKFTLNSGDEEIVASESSLDNVLSDYNINHKDGGDVEAESLPTTQNGDNLSIYVVNDTGRSGELNFQFER